MQQNFVLQALKILVILAFTIALGLTFFQNQSVETKVVYTGDEFSKLSTQVAEQGRRIDGAIEEMRAARAAAEATQQKLDAIVDLAAKGQLKGGGTGEGPSEAQGKPSVIAGKTVYPRNPGWTVLCDATTNDDPKRDLPPADQIDWDATLHDYSAGESKGMNVYSTDRNTTLVGLAAYILDGLAERKTSNYDEWNSQLAERIEESPDHTRYMIYMRKGVRWHEPEPAMVAEHPWLKEPHFVTAKDVKFTFELLKNPSAGSPLTYLFDNLEDVVLHDDYTIEIVWNKPDFYARATTLTTGPIPEHIWAYDPSGERYADADIAAQFAKHWFGKSICGNGPLRFVEYKRGEFVRCERYESYYGPRFPSKIYYQHIIVDDEARLARFWKELAYVLPSYEQYRKYVLEGDPSVQVYKFEPFTKPAPSAWKYTYFQWLRPTYSGFGWNTRKPLFADKRVRKALTMALNRQLIIDNIFYGLGQQLAVGESVYSPYRNDSLKPLPFDLDAAKRLFDEAGWKDGDGDGIREKVIDGKKVDFDFELLVAAASTDQRTMAQRYQEDLLKCGVRLRPNPADSALWQTKIHERSADGFIMFWTANLDSDPRQIWESKRADDPDSNNYTGFANPRADEIFQDLITTFDLDKRKQLFREWYEIQYDEQPYTWIYTVKSPIFVSAEWHLPEPQLPVPQLDRRLFFRWKQRP
ncbi:MAG TPA: ABC transporter substrate-binding protein [Planctomycetota bacterium]|nr:ABC transporter substrate-binding protein [Planctomycetota bacterium]